MDKCDVRMDDAIKHPEDLENGKKQLENDSVDGKVEADGKHSVVREDSNPTEVKVDDQDKGKSTEMGDKTSEVELSKNIESEGGNPNNTTSEVIKEAEDPDNATSEGVEEAEDPKNVTSEGVKEAEDPKNVTSEGVKEADNSSNEKNGGVKEADDADSVISEVKSATDGQHNFKSKDESKIVNESNGKDACENFEQDGKSSEKIVVDQKHIEDAALEKNLSEQGQHSAEPIAKDAPQNETGVADETMADAPKESGIKTASGTAVTDGDAEMGEAQDTKTEGNNTDQSVDEEMVNVAKVPENGIAPISAVADGITALHATPVTKNEVAVVNHPEPVTPTALLKCSTTKAGSHSGETYKNVSYESKVPGDEEGTPEEQATFMRELESFYRERAMEFKPPRFYGQQLNCLKLWRSVIRLGGYDLVTGSKLWRQVGESFHPPKTCTTVSWTFRIFYEKALLEYERYKRESGELQLPVAALPDPSGVDGEGNGHQASGSGRQRRDSAARAMQGWHAQRLFGPGEAGEPIAKDKNLNSMPKREKNLKSIGSLKQKRPSEVEHPVKAARTETSKQLVASVVDVGTPADWVKINVRETKDCFEVYALVPGLLREEVRVQSDPAGRLVITGSPEQLDNPWGITAFKKVVSLPARIDPLHTSAVVSLHGRLFVRVPFEPSNI